MIVFRGPVPGRQVFGSRFGVRPAEMPNAGSHPNALANDVDPGDELTEFCWVIQSLPPAGQLTPGDAGEYIQTGPPGVPGPQPWTYRLYTHAPGAGVVDRGVATVNNSFSGALVAVAAAETGDDVFHALVGAAAAGDVVVLVDALELGDDAFSAQAVVGSSPVTSVAVLMAAGESGDDRFRAVATVAEPPLPSGLRTIHFLGPAFGSLFQRQLQYLQPIFVGESDLVTFNFSRGLLAGERVTNRVVSITRRSGAPDAAPQAMAQGLAEFDDTRVVQQIVPTVAGSRYLLRCDATLNTSRVLVAAALMDVKAP